MNRSEIVGKIVAPAVISPLGIFLIAFARMLELALQYGPPSSLQSVALVIAGSFSYAVVLSIVPIAIAYGVMLVYVIPIHIILVRRNITSLPVYLIGSLLPPFVIWKLELVSGIGTTDIFGAAIIICLIFWGLYFRFRSRSVT